MCSSDLAYMSPEQARCVKVDARADVFAAGVMLWEAVTGTRLWGRQTDEEKLWSLVAGNLPRPSAVNPAVPHALDEICTRAMAWNRDDRYQSAGQFQRDLEHYIAAAGATVASTELGAHVASLYREDRIKAKYKDIITKSAGSPVNDVLLRQFADVKAWHDRVRQLRDSTKKSSG